jgi:hypothetical protein
MVCQEMNEEFNPEIKAAKEDGKAIDGNQRIERNTSRQMYNVDGLETS